MKTQEKARRFGFEAKLLVAFVAAVLVVLVLVVATWKVSRDSTEAALRMSSTHEILDGLAEVKGYASLIDASRLRYTIYGETAQLAERDAAVSSLETALHRIRELTANNVRQQERWTRLRETVDERLAITSRAIQLRDSEGFEVARAYTAKAPVRETRANLFRVLGEMEAEERRLLLRYIAEQSRARDIAAVTRALAVLSLLALLAGTYFMIRRQMRATEVGRHTLEMAKLRTQSILDTVADGIITIDERGSVETLNPAAERIFGYSTAEVIGQNIKMLMPEPYHSEHDGYLERYRATGEAHVVGSGRAVEVAGRRKDGSTFPLELAVSQMQLGAERRFTGIVRDVSARKQAELQTARSVKELGDFKAALDAHAIVVTTDAQGSITYVNDKFCAISKYAREELLGQDHRLINSAHHPQEFFAELWQTIAGGGIWKGEIRNQAKDGTIYWVDTTIVPFLGEDLKPVQYIAIRADITERKDAEQALIAARNAAERANRAKDAFLATMSHEIRTPLGGLMGMLELLSLSSLDSGQADTLQTARDSGRSLLRILNDILDWSKIEEGRLELALQATSLTALVAEVANTYSHVASGNSVTLTPRVDARLSPAHLVDPLRLSQVLNNFVSNAIKFSHGGRVELQAELIARREGAEEVRFSVRDTGIGIDPEAQQRLFRSYGQASADTARMYGGTGLGLAICRRLADLLDGRIELESAPGQGSTFSITLTLPIAESVAEAGQSQTERVALTAVQTLVQGIAAADAPLVLVVDDHPTNRKLLARQIGLLGLRAETAENGEAALALWRSRRHAMVITDCHMPVMDGYALTRAIRGSEAAEEGPRTPVLAWTANALRDEIENCRAAGMDELLVKPIDLAQLKQVLAKWLPIATSLPFKGKVACDVCDWRAGEGMGKDVAETPAVPPAPALCVPSGTLAPVDVSVLAALVGDDPAVIRDFLLDFRASAQTIATELAAACATGDTARAGAAAHKLKSSARAVGALALGELCAELEAAGKAADNAALGALHARFAPQMAAVDAALSSYTANNNEKGKNP